MVAERPHVDLRVRCSTDLHVTPKTFRYPRAGKLHKVPAIESPAAGPPEEPKSMRMQAGAQRHPSN